MMLWPHSILSLWFLVLQVLDVHSTNLALRQPGVVEIGDTQIGLGNIMGWGQRHLGRWWWLLKIPFAAPFTSLLWTPLPLPAEPAVCIMLGVFNAYFLVLVGQNYKNAKPREREIRICHPMP